MHGRILWPLVTLYVVVHLPNANCLNQFPEDYPQQVHISLGATTNSYTVTWTTFAPTALPTVHYSSKNKSGTETGSTKLFADTGQEGRQLYFHRVMLTNLMPFANYKYTCGSTNGWSKEFSFRALPDHSNWSPRVAMFGDMGAVNNQALPELKRQVNQLDNFDMLIHIGDIAYDLHDENSRVGDSFMRQIESIAAQVPYMTVPGNHDTAGNYSHYEARFTMPGPGEQSQYYSFNLGPVHFIGYSTELYYTLHYGCNPVVQQYNWIREDLKEANKPENRGKQPWIIVYGHRPMYCSNDADAAHCELENNIARTGYPPYPEYGQHEYTEGLENLFYEHGVDIVVTAHEHSYERLWPVYQRKVCNGSEGNPYKNPRAPVHFVTGSAGGKEGFDWFYPATQPWSAYRVTEYGFTSLKIHNETHITIEQTSVDRGTFGKVIDTFVVEKSNHGQGTYNCHLEF